MEDNATIHAKDWPLVDVQHSAYVSLFVIRQTLAINEKVYAEMLPMSAINKHEEETRIPLLPPTLLPAVPPLAIKAIPAGNDKTPAPIMDLIKLKISAGIVAVPTTNDDDDDDDDDDDAC